MICKLWFKIKDFFPKNKKQRKFIFYIFFLIFILALINFLGRTFQSSNFFQKLTPIIPQKHNNKKNEINGYKKESLKKTCTPYLTWLSDARQMYDYNFETEITLNDNAFNEQYSDSLAKKTRIIVHVSGVLNFRVFEKPEDWNNTSDSPLVYVAFQLSPVIVKYAEAEAALLAQDDLKELFQRMFCVAFLRNGLCFQFFFPDDLDDADRSSLSELIYAVQIVLSEKKNSSKWIVPEVHNLGRFMAEYRVIDSDCQLFEKQNVRCISLIQETSDDTSNSPFSLFGRIVESQFQLAVSKSDSWLKSCSGSEQIDLFTKKDVLWSSTKTYVKMNLLPFEPDSSLSIWSDKIDLNKLINSFFESKKSKNKKSGIWENKRIDSLKKRFNSTNLSQLLSDLENVLLKNSEQSKKAQLSHLIQDYFTAYPESVYQIPLWLKNGKITNKAAGHLMLALERVGHEDAQKALKSIFMDQEQDKHYRVQAIVASASVEKPVEELSDELLDIASNSSSESGFNEISSTTHLALGVLHFTYVKNGQDDNANEIMNQLKLSLKNSSTTPDTVTCFKALGNSKSINAIEVIKEYLPSIDSEEHEESLEKDNLNESDDKTDLSIEIASILTLGKMPKTDISIKSLTPLLDHDREIIRAATVDSLSQMEAPEITKAFCTHLEKETDESIRRKIIRYLGDHKDEEVIIVLENHLDLSQKNTQKSPISRDEAEDVYRALIKR